MNRDAERRRQRRLNNIFGGLIEFAVESVIVMVFGVVAIAVAAISLLIL